MRGNRRRWRAKGRMARSIPAYAGEPNGPDLSGMVGRVYPRVCGGTAPTIFEQERQKGLSPRMRGNLCQDTGPGFTGGSIPAYAGEPRQSRPARHAGEVYPRVCGGTFICGTQNLEAEGLSPRMRGNLHYI